MPVRRSILHCERGRGIDRDRAAGGDVDLEQPGDRLVEGIERLVGGDLLLGLALEDVLDGEVRGGTHSVALPAKPRPTAALTW